MKKIVLLAFVLVLLSTSVFVGFIRPVVAQGTIYIRADGSVEGTDKIQRDGDVYTFTDNIYDEIVVDRDDIVVDGAGYTVQGTGTGKGIDLSYRNNVTIKNVEVTNFNYGIYLYYSSNNTLAGNTASNNHIGIFLDISSNNVLTGNTASSNKIHGIDLWYSSNNVLFHNNLINNTNQVFAYESFDNMWDDGYPSGGNYWSDYTGEDRNGDGIGDTPYVIDENNQDNYPLMSPWSPPPIEEVPFWMQWWFWAIVIAGIVVLAGAVYFLKQRKPPTPTAPPLPTEGTLQTKTTQNTDLPMQRKSFLFPLFL